MALKESEELSWMSLAYIDAGIFLAESITKEEFNPSIHRNLVPLFLIHQGLELLFKGALKLRNGKYPKSHDLEVLKKEFDKEFPDLIFEIPECVSNEVTNNLDLFPELGPNKEIMHEKFRYPTDRKGNYWRNMESFNINTVLESLKNINQISLMVRLKLKELSGNA